ncbi:MULTISPECIES: 6-phosphogluconolactonase [Actinoalloteichus]|uniref:6-phosphogluconolactonase n=1 Tax=Actinoalloteichus fjordicus TaxID=1612552 RepID=A0AAC9PRM8_9PSEU|nr:MULTISPECIES: 6-phosphogluconolactonase [Actinoalloteichus]APU14539.1 6-phosphogluconolactonase [Actinoalloteichus fjordicus]APU20507.1 6-phosphogluconolactonase [Actinoalloteichus sp. GBA129-24]
MSRPELVVHQTGELLADAVAARLVTVLVDAQTERGRASLVLTGGRTGGAVLAALRTSLARDAVDWSAVDFYWGDERFLPAGNAERNETLAREALLDHLPIDPARVHPMAASDGPLGADPDAAAAAYAEVLAEAAGRWEGESVPAFDVCLLGVGEEGHTASIFPDSPAVHEQQRSVVAVRDCPKPPPTRISLTLPAIRASAQVWLITTGAGKAEAVAAAMRGADEVAVPAAGATGRQRTLWIVDSAAAALPDGGPPR